jgi:hypothetical protein
MKHSRLFQLNSSIGLTVRFWHCKPERLLLQDGQGSHTGNQDTLQKKIGDHWIGTYFLPCAGEDVPTTRGSIFNHLSERTRNIDHV